MPKKTKKEKLRAKLHRSPPRLSSVLPSPPLSDNTEASSGNTGYSYLFTPKKNTRLPPSAAIEGDLREIIAIKKDLYKTLTLAALAIASELGLYWYLVLGK